MDLAEGARRLGDDVGINTGNSQTGPFLAVKELFQAMTTIGPRMVAAPIQTTKEIAKEGAARMGAQNLALVFNNPESRNIYLGLAHPKRSLTREQIIGGVARIKAIVERDRQLFSGAPQQDEPQEQQPPPAPTPGLANEGAYP
jgi:hypothetical protein